MMNKQNPAGIKKYTFLHKFQVLSILYLLIHIISKFPGLSRIKPFYLLILIYYLLVPRKIDSIFSFSKGFYKLTMTISMSLLIGIGAGRAHMAIANFFGTFGYVLIILLFFNSFIVLKKVFKIDFKTVLNEPLWVKDDKDIKKYWGKNMIRTNNIKLSWKAIIIGFFIQLVGSFLIGSIIGFLFGFFLLVSGVPLPLIVEKTSTSAFLNYLGILIESFTTILGGYVAAWYAKHSELKHSLVVGILLEIVVLLDISFSPVSISRWYGVTWTLITIPSAVLGGYLRVYMAKRGK